jgi:hypothetical protein
MQDGLGFLLDASTEGTGSTLVAATTQKIRCVTVDTGLSMDRFDCMAERAV